MVVIAVATSRIAMAESGQVDGLPVEPVSQQVGEISPVQGGAAQAVHVECRLGVGSRRWGSAHVGLSSVHRNRFPRPSRDDAIERRGSVDENEAGTLHPMNSATRAATPTACLARRVWLGPQPDVDRHPPSPSRRAAGSALVRRRSTTTATSTTPNGTTETCSTKALPPHHCLVGRVGGGGSGQPGRYASTPVRGRRRPPGRVRATQPYLTGRFRPETAHGDLSSSTAECPHQTVGLGVTRGDAWCGLRSIDPGTATARGR